MKRDLQKYMADARVHFDKLLDEKIDALVDRTGIERERFVKINPMDFVETISGMVQSTGNIADYIRQYKTPDTFLISPIDAVEETANQICYKTHQDCTKIRAHKCRTIPIPAAVAQAFYIKNHRQSAVSISGASVSFALLYENEIVAVMTYDLTTGAVRGKAKKGKYELLRLAIKSGTQVNGGASKLQGVCEDALLQIGYDEIFSYSNATINEGGGVQKPWLYAGQDRSRSRLCSNARFLSNGACNVFEQIRLGRKYHNAPTYTFTSACRRQPYLD